MCERERSVRQCEEFSIRGEEKCAIHSIRRKGVSAWKFLQNYFTLQCLFNRRTRELSIEDIFTFFIEQRKKLIKKKIAASYSFDGDTI